MARARRRFQIRRVQPLRTVAAAVPTFISSALGTIDWEQWYSFEDYRIYTNLQVFAGGLSLYAGKPPTLQALVAAMQAVFDFARMNAPWPPPGDFAEPDKPDMAADAAIEVARVMYEENAIGLALAVLVPRWRRKFGEIKVADPFITTTASPFPG